MKYDLLQWHIAALEARATLRVVAERLAMNNYAGEEDPFIEDCENALNTISALPINEDAVRAHNNQGE